MHNILISLNSEILASHQPVRILYPDSGKAEAVLYLLHGFSDNQDTPIENSSIIRYFSNLPVMIVMPYGAKSFYVDMLHGEKYWTYITQELPDKISAMFQIADQKSFLAGISMGGYGALRWALASPDSFYSVFLFSPVTDIVKISKEGFDNSKDKAAFAKEALQLDNIFDLQTLEFSEYDILSIIKSGNFRLPYAEIYAGKDDFLLPDILAFCTLLPEDTFRFHTSEGFHAWVTWDSYLPLVAESIEKVLNS